MKNFFRSGCLVSLAIAASFASAQHAVHYGISLELENQTYDEYKDLDVAGAAVQNSIDVAGLGSSSGYANVGFGVNRASSTINGTNAGNPVDSASSYAESIYWDRFTISDPVLNGTSGSFDTTLFVHGSGNYSFDNSLITSSDVKMDGFWESGIALHAQGVGVTQTAFFGGNWNKPYYAQEIFYEGDPLNTYEADVTFYFVYGQPIDIETYLDTSLRMDNLSDVPGTFSASVDLSHSSYWGGIKNLQDQNGAAVTNYGYSSSSGYDYRVSSAPVPEPATIAALGLGLVAALRRRKR